MNTNTESNPTELHATIKLGIDAHAKGFYVTCQIDGATPQPVQKMTFDGLLRCIWLQKFLFHPLGSLPAEGRGRKVMRTIRRRIQTP